MRDDADTLGTDGIWFDPLWRITVELTPLESALLHTPSLRRLAFVSHAGAASITTAQTYSRLEHSLGLLALVSRFAPDDERARAAALLHDAGHLPFSHTLEGLGGLDHHELSREGIRTLQPLLGEHGLDADELIAIDRGLIRSPLRHVDGVLKLDHLDSFLRSGQAHGRLTGRPDELLGRLRLIDGGIDTDAETARELRRLAAAEARAQRAASNVTAVAVLRHLVGIALETEGSRITTATLPRLADDELWAALLTERSTRDEARAFRADPSRWRLLGPEARSTPVGTLTHEIRRSYLAAPTVDGRNATDAELDSLAADLPIRYLIAPPD